MERRRSRRAALVAQAGELGEFNWSMQHRVVAASVVAVQRLRRGSPVENRLGAHVRRDPPPHDHPSEGVDDEADVRLRQGRSVRFPSVSAWPYTPKIPPMAPTCSEPLRSPSDPTTPRDAYRTLPPPLRMGPGGGTRLTAHGIPWLAHADGIAPEGTMTRSGTANPRQTAVPR